MVKTESLASGFHVLAHEPLPDGREAPSGIGLAVVLANQVLGRQLWRHSFRAAYDRPQVVAPLDEHSRTRLRLTKHDPVVPKLRSSQRQQIPPRR